MLDLLANACQLTGLKTVVEDTQQAIQRPSAEGYEQKAVNTCQLYLFPAYELGLEERGGHGK